MYKLDKSLLFLIIGILLLVLSIGFFLKNNQKTEIRKNNINWNVILCFIFFGTSMTFLIIGLMSNISYRNNVDKIFQNIVHEVGNKSFELFIKEDSEKENLQKEKENLQKEKENLTNKNKTLQKEKETLQKENKESKKKDINKYYNASIINYDSNKFLIAARKDFINKNGNKSSSIIIGTLNKNLEEKYIDKIQEIIYEDNYKLKLIDCKHTHSNAGLEDPRIFKNGDNYYILATGLSKIIDCLWLPYLIKLTKDLKDVEFIKLLEHGIPKTNIKKNLEKHWQKNWNPLFHCPKTGKMLFSLEVSPHVIATIDDNASVDVLYKTYNSGLHKLYPEQYAIRGSTRCIDVGEYYLAIGHIVSPSTRIYTHIYYLINKEAPYNIVAFSSPFCLGENCPNVQFIMGLEKIDEKMAVITYGVKDKHMHIMEINIDNCINNCKENNNNTTYLLDKFFTKDLNLNGHIPKVIYQTCRDKDNLEYECISNIATWKELNPNYKHELHDDNECKEFLKKHFDPSVLKAFNILKPGAFKADLWRYAILYINGGVYADIDSLPLTSLDDILYDNYHFISVKERENNYGIYQAFMACSPRLPFLKNTIDTICRYTEIEYYPESKSNNFKCILSITGPRLLGEKYMKFLGKDLNKEEIPMEVYSPKFKSKLFKLGKRYIRDTCGREIIDSKNAEIIGEDYIKLFAEKQIYNKI